MIEYYQWKPVSKTHMQFYHYKDGKESLVKEPIEMNNGWKNHFKKLVS